MMWVLVAIAGAELLVTHLLLLMWRPAVAVVASMATAVAMAWLVGVILSMKRLPVLLNDRSLVMRVGKLRSVVIERHRIAGLRSAWAAADIKDRRTLNLALIAYPNVVVDLVAPLPGRRGIVAVAHRLDDPVAFAIALRELGERGD